jgi:class 3 adenylate cyclase/predicted alpha/beta hydrolase
MRPLTRYARSGDISIAYQVTGEGPVDLVWTPGTVSHLDIDWEWPPRARFLEQLASFCRLIRFDKRGTGLSDRPTKAATLEERTDDIRAVMDALGTREAFVFGVSEGANMACLFAATFPQRTRGLIIWGGQARWVKTRDYPWGSSREEKEREIQRLSENGIDLEYLLGPGAGLGPTDDPVFRDWLLRWARAGGSPSAAAALERMNAEIDVRDILPTIQVPTLVMNRTGDPVANVDAARDLASSIPGARFVEFPGNTHSFYTIEPERILGELKSFITGTPSQVLGDRVLATILFADIVKSTERAARLGDKAWTELLDHYYALVAQELQKNGGAEVDRVGDGIFATFDGPSRGIRCALAIRQAAGDLRIQVRCGLHTGEVEVVDRAVRGIAVHIAARIAELADSNEILVSSTVRDLVAGSGLAFGDRGDHTLKGVPESRRLFSLVLAATNA